MSVVVTCGIKKMMVQQVCESQGREENGNSTDNIKYSHGWGHPMPDSVP